MSSDVESVSSLAQLTPTAGGWIAAALVSAAGGLMALRRRASRDATERTKDRVESRIMEDLVSTRQADAELVRQVLAERAIDKQTIAGHESTIRHQGREIERLEREFIAFRRLMLRLYPDAARFLATQQSDSHVDPR